MKIGIDATPLAGRITGIGRYVLEICRELDKLLPEAQFFLYSHAPLNVQLPSDRWVSRVWGQRFPSSYVWIKRYVRAFAEADSVQVFWATRTILPRRSKAFRTLSTIYDLNYRVVPDSMPPITLMAHRLWFARDLRRANATVAISAGTAARLKTMLDIEVDAIAQPGVASIFVRQEQGTVNDRLAELGVDRPYFIAVGTVEPRKNFPALVEAFISLKRAGGLADHKLLIVGQKGWRDRRMRELFAEAEGAGIRWLGFVSDADLAMLYAGSSGLVFPSRYEGFGIPVLEAQASGARVVASDIPELREAGGSSGIYIEPTVTGIQEGLLQAANADGPADSAEAFPSWRDAARTMADVFRRLER